VDDEVESPFAWAGEEAPAEGPADEGDADAGGYFDGLLGWESREGA